VQASLRQRKNQNKLKTDCRMNLPQRSGDPKNRSACLGRKGRLLTALSIRNTKSSKVNTKPQTCDRPGKKQLSFPHDRGMSRKSTPVSNRGEYKPLSTGTSPSRTRLSIHLRGALMYVVFQSSHWSRTLLGGASATSMSRKN